MGDYDEHELALDNGYLSNTDVNGLDMIMVGPWNSLELDWISAFLIWLKVRKKNYGGLGSRVV